MEILHLAASGFSRVMGSGRTRPLLLQAEDGAGRSYEVVVKLRGPELSAKGQIAELVSAPLAELLGIDVPQAAVVNVPPGFDEVVQESCASAVRASIGANFGSIHLGNSFTTWPVGRSPVGVQRDQAAAIFAFDLLLQNPDRRARNPNVWARSDRLGVYDHEQAFSFLYLPIIGGPPRPWLLANQSAFRFMENHVFYAALRGGRLDLGPFEAKLAALSNEAIEGLLEPVPAEWRTGHALCGKIGDYLREARNEEANFLNFVKHLLR